MSEAANSPTDTDIDRKDAAKETKSALKRIAEKIEGRGVSNVTDDEWDKTRAPLNEFTRRPKVWEDVADARRRRDENSTNSNENIENSFTISLEQVQKTLGAISATFNTSTLEKIYRNNPGKLQGLASQANEYKRAIDKSITPRMSTLYLDRLRVINENLRLLNEFLVMKSQKAEIAENEAPPKEFTQGKTEKRTNEILKELSRILDQYSDTSIADIQKRARMGDGTAIKNAVAQSATFLSELQNLRKTYIMSRVTEIEKYQFIYDKLKVGLSAIPTAAEATQAA